MHFLLLLFPVPSSPNFREHFLRVAIHRTFLILSRAFLGAAAVPAFANCV